MSNPSLFMVIIPCFHLPDSNTILQRITQNAVTITRYLVIWMVLRYSNLSGRRCMSRIYQLFWLHVEVYRRQGRRSPFKVLAPFSLCFEAFLRNLHLHIALVMVDRLLLDIYALLSRRILIQVAGRRVHRNNPRFVIIVLHDATAIYLWTYLFNCGNCFFRIGSMVILTFKTCVFHRRYRRAFLIYKHSHINMYFWIFMFILLG